MDPQTQTMIDNLPTRTGRSLEQWYAVLDNAGPLTHGRALTLLKSEHGVSHGYANAIVTLHRARDAGPVSRNQARVATALSAPLATRSRKITVPRYAQ